MCLYPKLILNPKYTETEKNQGEIPYMRDKRLKYIPVGCGRCIECRKKKKREWQVRLNEELRVNKKAKFITLTFSEENLDLLRQLYGGMDYYNQICTVAMRRFLERWRKATGKSVKHWFITELGHKGTERIHLHGILFTDADKEFIEKTWHYGMIWVGKFVNEKTINYITKYVLKTDQMHQDYMPKILCSKGIGADFVKTGDWQRSTYKRGYFGETEDNYRLRSGFKLAMPMYYRNKIYTEEQRENLWLEKLDKQERYVLGTRIFLKSSKGWKHYWKALECAQEKNVRLGFPDGNKEWSKSIYSYTLDDINGTREAKRKARRLKKKAKHYNTMKRKATYSRLVDKDVDNFY
ncbi:replication initiator protein [Sigmofec virus UA08Rod_4888]|uniref:Replication initiator protein n=1 Tax=Sigmofec virus UA08Rod_4888 TaxID=2929412 RepID=A0A976N0X1_9VIRU|nr:replication initiator protein [Sigmofec virus UA08Rod_4888]